MIRRALAAVIGSKPVAAVGQAFPPVRTLSTQFVAGDTLGQALPVVKGLISDGYLVTMDYLGEAVTSAKTATAITDEYLDLMQWLAVERLTDSVEASVKLSALGQALTDEPDLTLDNARLICAAAREVGSSVTFDMEDHRTTDQTLDTWRQLLPEYPSTGIVLQARLYRTDTDLETHALAGHRIRLCKGAYAEPADLAHRSSNDVDLAYVRSLKKILASDAYAMIATHDKRLIKIAQELVERYEREPDSYEFQFLYGVHTADQERLRKEGERVRLYVPYGTQWYQYFSRRLVERPANVGLMVGAIRRRFQ